MEPGKYIFQSKTYWFPFEVKEWMSAVQEMPAEERGAYISLLARQWDEPTCTLPNDMERLCRIAGVSNDTSNDDRTMDRILIKFTSTGDRIYNEKLYQMRIEAEEKSDKARQAVAARELRKKNGRCIERSSNDEQVTVRDRSIPPRDKPNGLSSPPLLSFECNGPVKEWHLTQDHVDQWREAYPELDVIGECKKAKAWTLSNQKKTAKGMKRFLNGWLSRANDRRRPDKQQPTYGMGSNREDLIG